MKNFNQLVEDMLTNSKVLTINGERTISGVWPTRDFGQPFMVDFREGGTGQIHPEIAIFLESEPSDKLIEDIMKKNDELYRRLSVSEFQDLLKRHGFEHKHTRIGKEGVEHWRISLGYPDKIASEYYNLLFHNSEAWLDVVFVDSGIMVLISYTVGEFEFAEIADTNSIQTAVKTFEDIKQIYKLLTGEYLIDGINVEGVEWKTPSPERIGGATIRGKNKTILELKIENCKLEENIKELKERLDKTVTEKESADTWAYTLKCELYSLAREFSLDKSHIINFGTLEALTNFIKSTVKERDQIIAHYQNLQKQTNAVKNEWVWYEHQGHVREGCNCDYVEYTEIGNFAVSTIGECWLNVPGWSSVPELDLEIPFYVDGETGNEYYYQTKTFLILERDDNDKPIEKRELYSIFGEKYVDAKQNHHSELLKVDRGFYNGQIN